VLLAFRDYSFADCSTHLAHIFPRDRSFEGFGDEVVPEAEIPEIADHESQEVSPLSILCASPEALMCFCNSADNFLLVLHLQGIAFEENGAKSHFIGVEAHHFSNEVFFGRVDYLVDFALVLHLQGHSELELLVVHKAQTGRPDLRLRHLVHKFDSNVEIVEKKRFVYLFLRNGANLHGDFSDNAEISLMSKNKFVDIWSGADSGSVLRFLEGADRCGNFDADDYIIDISIFILLHA
jgi:hypothetical protein